jgi:Protein of unknown function (DUF2811)
MMCQLTWLSVGLTMVCNLCPSSETLMKTMVSILAEIPEELHDTLQLYLDGHPDWDQNRIFTAALSLFLLQNGNGDRRAARTYLNTLFQKSS